MVNYDLIRKVRLCPRVSEKATRVADAHNQYVFTVAKDAAKPAIRYAVEKLFGVNVTSVNVTNRKSEVRRTVRGYGKRGAYRKAYVTIRQGEEINFQVSDA